jgi:hypothetical protein
MGKKSHISKKIWQIPIFTLVMILKLIPLFIDQLMSAWQPIVDSGHEHHHEPVEPTAHDESADNHEATTGEHHKEDPETEEEREALPRIYNKPWQTAATRLTALFSLVHLSRVGHGRVV